jgi:heptosyltransferase-2
MLESYNIVLLGSANEKILGEKFPVSDKIYNFIGKIDFLQSAKLIENAEIVICNDSSIMHLANALEKKISAFFGPTTEYFGFTPIGINHIIFQINDLSCRPCSHIGSEKCPKKHFRCMKDIPVDNVFIRMKELLE